MGGVEIFYILPPLYPKKIGGGQYIFIDPLPLDPKKKFGGGGKK